MPTESDQTPAAPTKPLLTFAFICGVLALVYAPAVLLGEVFFRRDISRYVHPLFAQVRARLAHGELPLWSRAEFGGVPLLGDVSSATLYPPNLLLAWMSPAAAISLLIVGHHALAAQGATTLLRRWGTGLPAALAGGLGFSLAGYLVAMDNSMIYLVGVCWGPWVLWALDRLIERRSARNVATLAGIFALLFTSGELQFTYLCVLVSGAYVLTCARPLRPGLIALGVAGIASLGLVAVQLLPLLSVVMDSTRAQGLEVAAAQSWALHPARLLELFTAHPFGLLSEQSFWGQALVNSPGHTTPWSNGLYLGAALPWLALCAPRDRRSYFLWTLGGLAVLLGLGPHTPFDAAFREAIPLWSAFRYPEKLMSLGSLALCLAAGRGLAVVLDNGGGDGDRYDDGAARNRWPLRLFGALTLLALSLALWLHLAPAAWTRMVDGLLAAGNAHHVDRTAALGLLHVSLGRSAALLLCATLLVAAGAQRRFSHTLRAWAWVALIVVDVGAANARLIELAPRGFYDSPSPLSQALEGQFDPSKPQRVHRLSLGFPRPPQLPLRDLNPAHHHWMRMTLAPKAGVEYDHVRHATGYSASMSARFRKFWGALRSARDDRVLDLMAVGFVIDNVRTHHRRDAPQDRVIARFPALDARLVARGNATDMARVVHHVVSVEHDDDALMHLTAPGFDVRNSAVIEGELPSLSSMTTRLPASPVTWITDRHERLEMDVAITTPGVLVIAATHDPKWRVSVNGKPAPLLRANYLQQGVALEAGRHRVVLRYHDGTLLPGALISLIALLTLGVAVLRERARRTPPGTRRS